MKNGGFIMNEYQLISDYKQNEKYKESFNDLAKHVFELDFKGWYDRAVGMITIFAILMWMEIKSSQINLLIK